MTKAAYIHIPFCHHICHYCDFNKVFMKNQPVEQYLNCLDREMSMAAFVTGYQTIFVGGGTPTSLNAQQLFFLVDSIHNRLPLLPDAEYTFEANPGDLTPEKLRILKEGGVNRLSIGVQSFNDAHLKRIGRTHTKEDVLRTVRDAEKAGFDNLSIDLIYGLPEQTVEDAADTVKQALGLGLPHYSAYSLIIEPKTVFYNLMAKGKLPLPKEESEADMYEAVMREMAAGGLHQYEISNFARPGFESLHNLTYWNNDEYYGFGAGAHGYVNGERYANFGPLKKYMEPIERARWPRITNQKVTKREQMEEEMFLGLRKMEGVSISSFESKYSENPLRFFHEAITDMTDRGLLEIKANSIRLTHSGKFLGNEVFQSFLI
ncbi:radical SAM family heme chaperone HemW [Domibacillus sp. A3M-37]|uniref:radical SAM family heme chaperone HemW n=1 Tax=Domibacillus sp. A3M-37 TaxID=2962037 RepID=UPI0020B6ED0A|nr:radical SAM family heme chaperone HemW [Domibacillus sp. A3M-37]MCP3764288.1 radical SAM family heme chaperone HemW [Domibacillus sp. A3M-37]